MRELSGPATVVRCYVMTCPNRVSEGLFQLPVGIIVHDTGLAAELVDQALDELEAAGLVSYDRDAEVVLDRTALRFSPLRNGLDAKTGEVKPDKRIAGAVRLFENVPESPLKAEFYRLATVHSPDLAHQLGLRCPSLTRTVDNPDVPFPAEAPSKPLGRSSQAPSRGESSREEESRGVPVCGVQQCGEPAVGKDDDGFALCGEHEGVAFSELRRFEEVAP